MTTDKEYEWCNLCFFIARNVYVHMNGKRHKRLMKKYEMKYRELPDVVKFKIISFLYTNILDKIAFIKLFITIIWNNVLLKSMCIVLLPVYVRPVKCQKIHYLTNHSRNHCQSMKYASIARFMY